MIPFCDTSDETLARTTFADFYALNPSSDTTRIHPYTQQNKILDKFVPHGPRTMMCGFNYQNLSVSLLNYALEVFKMYITTLGDNYVESIILFEGYPMQKVCQIPLEATACASRHSCFRTAMAIRWKDAQHDTWVRKWLEDFVDGAVLIDQTLAKVSNLGPETHGYANFSMPETKVADIFSRNIIKLEEIKAKWDPNGRFNKWFDVSRSVK
jgi:hypothetical protein